MPQVAPSQTATTGQYRYRSGSTISTWMSAEQLKEAALRGELTPESHIQQVGHAEWIAALNVKGLTFPPAGALTLAPEAAPVAAIAEPAANSAAATRGHPRFMNLRDVLLAYLNADIEINVPNPREHGTARIVAVGTDHFELVLETERSRVFIPYAEIRAIWSCETSASSTLTYRESHRLTVDIQLPRT